MRALMAFLLGGWLIGMIFVAVVAAENFFMVDRLLESPAPTEFQREFQQRLAPLPDGDARVVLRYLSSELNRFYFWVWGGAEIVLGGPSRAHLDLRRVQGEPLEGSRADQFLADPKSLHGD